MDTTGVHAELCKPNAFLLCSHNFIVTATPPLPKKKRIESVHQRAISEDWAVCANKKDLLITICLLVCLTLLQDFIGFICMSDRSKNWPRKDAVSEPRRLESLLEGCDLPVLGYVAKNGLGPRMKFHTHRVLEESIPF